MKYKIIITGLTAEELDEALVAMHGELGGMTLEKITVEVEA